MDLTDEQIKMIEEVTDALSKYENADQITDQDLGKLLRTLDGLAATYDAFQPLVLEVIKRFGRTRCQDVFLKEFDK